MGFYGDMQVGGCGMGQVGAVSPGPRRRTSGALTGSVYDPTTVYSNLGRLMQASITRALPPVCVWAGTLTMRVWTRPCLLPG